MDNKIFKAINSFKSIKNMNIGWYDLIIRNVSTETVGMIDRSPISLKDLADVIIDTMHETQVEADIERLLLKNFNKWESLH